MKYLFFASFLFCFFSLAAQTSAATGSTKSPIFIHAGLGVLPAAGLFNAEISAAVGYRFKPSLGLGVAYRQTTTHNESFGHSAELLGLNLRAQSAGGLLLNLGGGVVLSATEGSDGFDSFEYRSGGHYLAFDLGYQFRWGGTLGFYVTSVRNTQHDHIRYNLDTDEYERTGRISKNSFWSLGPKIGYAFSRRGKRNLGNR